LQAINLIRSYNSKYTRNSNNSIERKQITQLKMNKRSEKTIYHKRRAKGQQVCENMLIVSSPQGNANQNHSEIDHFIHI
jgi:hypothetical protein